MTKQTLQRKGVLTVAILMMLVLVFAGMFIASMTGSNKSANAADYSYNEQVNKATWEDDTGLTVVFTCESNGLNMYDWALFLFSSSSFSNVPYDNATHKLTNSANMGQNNASYYFDSNVSTETGTITVTYGKDQTAQGKSKTLADIWAEDDWRVVIGPHHSYYGDESYNCDYYVGSSAQIISSSISITFYNYDGTQLTTSNSIDPPTSDPTRTGYTFDGWYCDTNKKVYTSDEVDELSASDVAVNGTANFYATYKKTNADSDYLEFTVSVVSENGDIVTDGNVGRPYASANDMDYVSVKYEITHNPGINNLLLILDYDTDVFTLGYEGDGKITYPNAFTGLGEATPRKDVPNGFVWDITGNAYESLEEVFTVKYAINQNKVVSGTTYYFGVKIYPYGENASSVSYRIETVDDQLGEQVDVPITQVVKTFTPVVREQATITIGGNKDGDPRYYQRPYGLQFTEEKVETLPEYDVEDDYTEEDAYTVHYTYDGDGVVVVTWYQNVNNQYVSMQSAPQMPGSYKVGISAPATLNYCAVDAVYCEVNIYKLNLEIVIGGGSHTYLGEPVTYYSTSGSASATFTPYLKTQGENPATVTLNSSTDVGTYDIYYDLSYNEDIYIVTVDGSSTEGNGIKSNRTYTVNPKAVAFTVEAQGHTYGDTPEAIGFTGSENGITFTPSIAKNSNAVTLSSTTPVDTYDIMYTLAAGAGYKLSNYAISVNNVLAGASGDTGVDYTVSPKVIYLKAANQIHIYTGAEVTTPYSGAGYFGFYTDEECQNGYSTSNFINFDPTNVSITFTHEGYEHYVDLGTYADQILATYSDPNHTIYPVKGKLYIRGTQANYYYQFFEVFNETYTGQSQTMIRNKTALPEWVTSVAYKVNSDESYGATIETPHDADPAVIAADAKTNAGTYVYTILITFESAADFDGEHTSVEITHQNEEGKNLTASIAKATITLGAVGGSHTYGQNPTMNYAAPTRGTEYTSSVAPFGDLVVATSIDTTLSSTTNAGTYTVTVSATSEGDNFEITYDPEEATYTVNKATPSINLVANNVYYNRDLSVTATATPNVGTATLTYYTDSACTIAVDNNTPVNAGTYYVKASVEGNSNYNGYTTPEAVSFDILQVQLKGVVFSYLTPGYATWSAVTSDYGKTVFNSNETGVAAADIKSGTTLEYDVYEGGVKIETISSGEFSLQARVAGQAYYYVIARATNNDNYLDSPLVQTVNSYSVTYACDHANAHASLDNTTHELPAVQYRFGGQSVTLPAMNALGAYNFLYWNLNNNHYNAGSSYQINGSSVTFYAVWSQNTYKVYLKYFNEFTALELNCVADSNVTYSPSALAKLNTLAGYSGVADDDYRVVAWKYNGNVVYTITGEEGDTINLGITATENGMVFDAVLEFAIDYYFVDEESVDYSGVTVDEYFVEYGATIDYKTINTTYNWFKADYWYLNEARTNADIPSTMPAHKVNLYGGYKFDIGYGDVNGSGTVTADDITLYRKWIVGGYSMTVVEIGNEWATVSDSGFDPNGIYFIKRVADINVDESKDIRDVSITRMALVGGYTWDIVTGETVTGGEIVRSQTVNTYEALAAWFENGHDRISLNGNVTSASADFVISTNKNIYIDLCGNTLTVRSINFSTSGNGATITVKNGTIVTTSGITITAPNGNVIIRNVTAYDNGNEINLQAASNSLHFFGNVSFRNGTVLSSTAADVKVAEGTHIVIEEAAQLVAQKIVAAVVTNNTFVADETAEISVTNESATTEPIVIVGQCVEDNSTVGNKIVTKVSSLEELIAANGKSVYLGADIETGNVYIAYSQNTTINLNGHSVTFGKWGFEINSGATLVIGGEGSVTALKACFDIVDASTLYISGGVYESTGDCAIYCRQGSSLTIDDATITAQEACVVAYENSQVLIEDGEFTSVDNFVIGTNGTTGKGGNVITINGGVFNGGIQTNGYIACGVYVANNDTVTVSGGTFNITNGIGILARSGNTTIGEDVVFNIEGNSLSGGVGDKSLNITSGSAIVKDLTNPAYPGGAPTVTNGSNYEVVTLQ